MTIKEKQTRKCAQQRKWRQSPKGRAYYRKYNSSPKKLAYRRKRRQRPEVRAAEREYEQRPEVRAAKRKYNQSPKGRAAQRKYRYGLPPSEYLFLLRKQKSCAICRKKFTGTPHVDHNHKTNKVRKLLCSACNFGLGLFRDSPALLISATKYLQAHA